VCVCVSDYALKACKQCVARGDVEVNMRCLVEPVRGQGHLGGRGGEKNAVGGGWLHVKGSTGGGCCG